MILYQINDNGNKYCGPAVISALAGIGTKEAAAIIREKFGDRSVRATTRRKVQYALDRLGFGMLMMPAPKKRVTLRQWAKDTARGTDVWLVSAGSHWILVQGRWAMCGKTTDLVPVADHPHARSVVQDLYRVTKEKKVRPETVIPTKLKLEAGEAYARRQAKTLATRHGIEVERENADMAIWIWPPAIVPQECDPYDEHFVDYWAEALVRVKEYVRVKKELEKRQNGAAGAAATPQDF